jgi:hypothetical protein
MRNLQFDAYAPRVFLAEGARQLQQRLTQSLFAVNRHQIGDDLLLVSDPHRQVLPVTPIAPPTPALSIALLPNSESVAVSSEKYRLRVSSFAPNFPSIPWEKSFIGDIGCRLTLPPCAILMLVFAFQAPVVRNLARRVLDCALCALAER